MTPREIIELFKRHEIVKFIIPGLGETELKTAELKQVVEALEKQTPKKPKEHYNWCDFSGEEKKENARWFCSSCDGVIDESRAYCPSCGQRLDWGSGHHA